jgi:hypothetical protein
MAFVQRRLDELECWKGLAASLYRLENAAGCFIRTSLKGDIRGVAVRGKSGPCNINAERGKMPRAAGEWSAGGWPI